MENNEKMVREEETLKEAQERIQNMLEEVKTSFKKSAVNMLVYGVVAGCTSYAFDIITKAFLPKEIRGVAKIGVAASSFLIPELIAQKMGGVADKIMEET